jgi:ABC-type multidrug transport system fused ATPase/permease subunit
MTRVGKVARTIVLPRWKSLLVGLGLVTINRLCGLVLPGSTKVLIDQVIPDRDASLLTTVVIFVGAAMTVQALSAFLVTRWIGIEAQRLIAEMRAKVQQHVVHLPVGYFDNTKSGALVSRIMTDADGVRNLVGTGLIQLVGGLLTAIVSLVILVRIDAVLTAVAIVPLVVFGLVSMKAFAYIRPIFRERSKIRAEVTGRLTESLGGIRVVKGFHAEEAEKRVFETGVHRIFENVKRTMTASSIVTGSATFLMGMAMVLIMHVGGGMMIDERLSTGDFVSFTLYLGFLIMPIVQMSSIGTQLTEAFAGLDRVEELLAEPREGDEPGRTNELANLRGDISVKDLSFSYGSGVDVLHDISLEAPAGTVTALVGSSGSGKTTLAGLIASFLTPTSGTVSIDGVDLATVKISSYRQRLGVVLQDDFLFEGTIRENIRFSRAGATDDEVQAAAQSAHVLEFTDGFEKGLETIIGERGIKLSGGQRQRVSIARALLADPQVLILDEATSSLDTESEALIQLSLTTLMQNRTSIVIAHRLSTIRAADQIVVLEHGRIVERGSHDTLIASQGRYFDLHTYQARI